MWKRERKAHVQRAPGDTERKSIAEMEGSKLRPKMNEATGYEKGWIEIS